MLDSATLAKRRQFVADSITKYYFFPDSMRKNEVLSNIWTNKIPGIYFNTSLAPQSTNQNGEVRKMRDLWLIFAVCGLLIYTAILNLLLGKDIKVVIQSFYYKQALSQPNKEGGPINFWAFVGLFLLFSLTFGLVLCQLSGYYNLYYGVSDFQLFILLSFVIGLLFALKFLVSYDRTWAMLRNKPYKGFVS